MIKYQLTSFVHCVLLAELYKGIEEVDEMLKFNIVQGTLNNRGNFGK